MHNITFLYRDIVNPLKMYLVCIKTTQITGSIYYLLRPQHQRSRNKAPCIFIRRKRPVCPWTWSHVESLQLWIIIQTDFIIKNHHDEDTGIHTAGAYWLPTGGEDLSPWGVSLSRQLVYVHETVCTCIGTVCTVCACLCWSVRAYYQPLNSSEALCSRQLPLGDISA